MQFSCGQRGMAFGAAFSACGALVIRAVGFVGVQRTGPAMFHVESTPRGRSGWMWRYPGFLYPPVSEFAKPWVVQNRVAGLGVSGVFPIGLRRLMICRGNDLPIGTARRSTRLASDPTDGGQRIFNAFPLHATGFDWCQRFRNKGNPIASRTDRGLQYNWKEAGQEVPEESLDFFEIRLRNGTTTIRKCRYLK